MKYVEFVTMESLQQSKWECYVRDLGENMRETDGSRTTDIPSLLYGKIFSHRDEKVQHTEYDVIPIHIGKY